MEVAFDTQTVFELDAFDLMKAHGAQLRALEAEIAQTKKNVGLLWVHFANQSSGSTTRVEEFHDGRMILVAVRAVSEELTFNFFSQ
jgi:hypothetical protein